MPDDRPLGQVVTPAPAQTPDGRTLSGRHVTLERIVPEDYMLHAHHWLILHGRYVCKARKPACGNCIISDLCKSPEKAV